MNAIVKTKPVHGVAGSAEERVGRYDWAALAAELDCYGSVVLEKLLSPEECARSPRSTRTRTTSAATS